MEKTLMERIDSLHGARECSGAVGRVRCAVKLLWLYAAFAVHRSYLLLLKDPARSFRELHQPNKDGSWTVSYVDHLRFRVRMRVYAFGTAISVLASFAITISLVQLSGDNTTTYALTIVEVGPQDGAIVFDEKPNEESLAPANDEEEDTSDNQLTSLQAAPSFGAAAFAAQATNNISVTTTNQLGAGSLSESLNTANVSAVNDINNVRFTVPGTYTLGTEQPVVRRVNFTNTSGGRVIIDGSSLGANDSCLNFNVGSDNSSITGIQFQDCPTAITLESDGVTIGSASGATQVTIAGGQNGISTDTGSDDHTIQYVTIGQDDLGNSNALNGDAITIKGDNTTITQSTIGNALNGIVVFGDNTTITASSIGIATGTTNIGATADGIKITGSGTTVGGTTASLGNTIAFNGQNGLSTGSGADNTTIQNNTFGLTSADGDAGNGQTNISVVAAGSETATIEDNRVAYAGTDGLYLVSGQSVSASGNSFFSNDDNGVNISGGSGHVFNQNTFGVFVASDGSTSAGGNGSSGVVISGAATDHVFSSGTFSNNTEYGVEIKDSSSERITITENDYTDNVLGEISLASGANDGVTPLTLSSATSAFVSGTGAESAATIEVYVDGEYLESTSNVESDGSWSVDVGASTSLQATASSVVGSDVTALQIDSDGNTSEFSNAVVGENAGDAFSVKTSVEATTTTATITVINEEQASTALKHGSSASNLSNTVTRATLKNERSIELTGLRPNTTYYYQVTAENSSNETVKTQVLTFSTKSSRPVLTSLSGDFSVVTQPETLSFEGEVNGNSKSHFRFVNPDTDDTIAVCDTDENHVCTLPYTLSIGEYDVYFDSATKKGITTESSRAHRLVVSPPVVTDLLTGDKRTEDYFTRVVYSDLVTLIGLQPVDSDITVTVNGVEVDANEIESTGDASFRATLDLSSLDRGRDYLIEVDFTDADTGDVVPGGLYYPIKYAYLVVEPQVSGIGTGYSLGQDAAAIVTAGANDTLTVTDNGEEYLSTTLPQIDDTVQGQTSFSLPTDTIGTHTLTIQTTNSIGLSSSIQSYTYTVFGAAPAEPTGVDTPQEADEGETEEDNQEANGDGQGDTNDDEDDTLSPFEEASLKARLNNLLRSTLVIEARRLILDADGNVIGDAALERNVNGDVILRSQETIGLRPSTWLDFGSTNAVDVLQFSGVSEPFATVTLTIFSDPIIQVTEADDKGAWTMNVAVSDLPEGQHTAFLKSESGEVQSDEVEIARFVVVQEQQLSNTSWILIVNVFIAFVIISIMITVRIQHLKEERRFKEVRANRKEITPEDLITELRQKQEKDDDNDDLHSTLGV